MAEKLFTYRCIKDFSNNINSQPAIPQSTPLSASFQQLPVQLTFRLLAAILHSSGLGFLSLQPAGLQSTHLSACTIWRYNNTCTENNDTFRAQKKAWASPSMD